jgi:primase-polymerase (primpol)-like protein
LNASNSENKWRQNAEKQNANEFERNSSKNPKTWVARKSAVLTSISASKFAGLVDGFFAEGVL